MTAPAIRSIAAFPRGGRIIRSAARESPANRAKSGAGDCCVAAAWAAASSPPRTGVPTATERSGTVPTVNCTDASLSVGSTSPPASTRTAMVCRPSARVTPVSTCWTPDLAGSISTVLTTFPSTEKATSIFPSGRTP